MPPRREPTAAPASWDRPPGGQHLFGTGPDTDVFGEVLPANGSGTIDEELGGASDVLAVVSAVFVQHIITPNHLGFGIGKKGKGVTGLSTKILRLCRRIDADRDRADALCLKLRQIFLYASQLEVTVRSPISAIEDEKHGFRWSGARRGGEKLRKRNRLPFTIGQGEVGNALSDVRRAR